MAGSPVNFRAVFKGCRQPGSGRRTGLAVGRKPLGKTGASPPGGGLGLSSSSSSRGGSRTCLEVLLNLTRIQLNDGGVEVVELLPPSVSASLLYSSSHP